MKAITKSLWNTLNYKYSRNGKEEYESYGRILWHKIDRCDWNQWESRRILFMHLTSEMIEEKPLYDIFHEDFHQVIRLADEEFFASIASAKDAALLKIHEGAPVLNLVRSTFNIENEVIEYTLSVARADQFRYKVRHLRNDE